MSDYWEEVLDFYTPFNTAPRAGSAEVYIHEMPGGQFTNLKEQANAMGLSHRWPEIARCYAEVNQLFGDIIKVTPSSKVVGDMCMGSALHANGTPYTDAATEDGKAIERLTDQKHDKYPEFAASDRIRYVVLACEELSLIHI